jgi:hypothetical protein
MMGFGSSSSEDSASVIRKLVNCPSHSRQSRVHNLTYLIHMTEHL